jgi:hypothetical protein
LDETVAKLGDADLDFRPFPAAWLLLHIAQEETGERDYGIRQILSDFPSDFHPEDPWTPSKLCSLPLIARRCSSWRL